MLTPRALGRVLVIAGLLIGCGEQSGPESTNGALAIKTSTTGTNPDDDGYSFSIDGGSKRPVGPNQRVVVPDLSAGEHQVTLDGIAANCEVQSDNPRSVTVIAADTSELSLPVLCSDATGSIVVTTRTTGETPDPDGYTLALDGNPVQSVAIDETARLSNVMPGPHVVTLSGLAPNCVNGGSNPTSVMVAGGKESTVQFEVRCPAYGALRITTSTTGDNPDPNGYSLRVDRDPPATIAATGITVLQSPAGQHELTLGDVASNCALIGDATRLLVVQSAVTIEVNYQLECSGPGMGILTVSTRTTSVGNADDANGYTATLDDSRTLSIGPNDRVSFGPVAVGSHSVRLGGLAPFCGLFLQSNPKTITVRAGSTANIEFDVLCLP